MYVKQALQPEQTDSSRAVLTAYYQLQRRADSRNAARTTIRLLESLIRLSQAHARLMMRPKVTLDDAVAVVLLMETTLHASSALHAHDESWALFNTS